MSPRSILMAGMAVLIAGNLVLAKTDGFAGLVVGVGLWGAHMALTQGIFSRMIADSAPERAARDQLRRLLVRERDRRACSRASAPGWLWDRDGAARPSSPARVAAVALAMLSCWRSASAASGRALRAGALNAT